MLPDILHIPEDPMLHSHRLVAVVSLLATGLLGSWSGAQASAPAPPPAGTTCTWGGTAVDPTGTFTITPGLTNDPSTAPSRFFVTGELGGDPGCRGTLTYIGQIDAGGTCADNFFDGAARGVPGVKSFAGVGVGPLGPARLYDARGDVVASENADVNTADNIPHFLDCSTPAGFAGGNFHSVIIFTK
jgi:hypothetical protein